MVNNDTDNEESGEVAEATQFRMTTSTTGPQSSGPQSSASSSNRDAEQFACRTCNRSFLTKRGLGVHIQKAHPAVANDAISTERLKRRWNEEEIRLMVDLEAEATITETANMNQHLKALMTDRTLEAIKCSKCQRKKADYRLLVSERIEVLRNSNAETPPTSGPPQVNAPVRDDRLNPSSSTPNTETRDRPHDMPSDSTDVMTELRNDIREMILKNLSEISGIKSQFAKDLVQWGKAVLTSRGIEESQFMEAISSRFPNMRPPKGPMLGKTTEYHGTSKEKRKQRYAVVQSLYRRDIGAAARVVLNENDLIPTKIPPVRHLLEYWKDIFATSGKSREVTSVQAVTPDRMRPIWKPVTMQEIKSARTANEKSAGPDGMDPYDWNRLDDRYKCLIYNVFLLKERVPAPLKGSRTVFLSKVEGGSSDPGDFRPLTICSVMLREYNKILAHRFVECYTYDKRQTAYLPIDGVCINVTMLTAMIAEAKRLKKELHIAILDLVKAFNSVYHSAIVDAITEAGCPQGFISYVRSMYSDVQTNMQFEGQCMMARIAAGVYQGDPLSGPLFTLAYEKALRALNDQVGYQLAEERINASAYSDDGVLMAMTVIGLQHNLDKFCETLAKIGLKINPRKSRTNSYVPSGKEKKMKVGTNRNFIVNGERIEALTITDFWRYLGVVFEASGPEKTKVNLADDLMKLTRGPLKPQQRVEMLKTFVITKHQHKLVLSRTTASGLNKLDLQIRRYVRQWLHLPKDAPTAFIHAPVRSGGLGIPCLKQWIPLMRFLRLSKIRDTGSSRVAAVLNSDIYRGIIHSAKKALSVLGCGDAPTLEGYHAFWKKKLLEMVDCKDLRMAESHASSTSFNSTHTNMISGEDYIHYNQIRSNSVPTRKRTARGRQHCVTTCRAGCRQVETLQHVIQSCVRTHGGRIKRHDRVVDLLSDEFKMKRFVVNKEVHFRTSQGLLKPDLILTKDHKAWVVDAQVVQCGKLEMDDRMKISKYRDDPDLTSLIREKYGVQAVEYTACTLSYKGIWSKTSVEALTKLGMSKWCLFKVVTSVLRGSWLCWKRFNQTTTVMH